MDKSISSINLRAAAEFAAKLSSRRSEAQGSADVALVESTNKDALADIDLQAALLTTRVNYVSQSLSVSWIVLPCVCGSVSSSLSLVWLRIKSKLTLTKLATR